MMMNVMKPPTVASGTFKNRVRVMRNGLGCPQLTTPRVTMPDTVKDAGCSVDDDNLSLHSQHARITICRGSLCAFLV